MAPLDISTSSCPLPARLVRQAFDHLPKHFQRRRGSLGPRVVFLTLMVMSVIEQRSYHRALTNLRSQLGRALQWVGGEPTKGAFAQARRKLKPEACLEAFRTIRKTFVRARETPRALYRGRRIFAVDGTKLTLPACPALANAFGCPHNQSGVAAAPQAGLVLLWDVSSNQPVAWKLDGYRLGEREAAMALLAELPADSLLIADRGYPGFEFFHAVEQRKAAYLIRMNTTSVAVSHELASFLASSAAEAVVTCPSVVGGFRRFPGERSLRIRFIRDPENSARILATNLLDPVADPASELLARYHDRWSIETAFREAKIWHGLEDFHAHFADGIHQEVAVIMAFMYLTGEVEAEMRDLVKRRVEAGEEPASAIDQQPYRFNRLYIGDAVIYLFLMAIERPKDLAEEWRLRLRGIWRDRTRKPTGRSYPRRSQSPRGISRSTRPRGKH